MNVSRSHALAMPADAGLTGLGLTMRVFGGIGLCLATAATVFIPLNGGSVSASPLVWLYLVGALIRSVIHINAGAHAMRRAPTVRSMAIVYLVAGLAHTALGLTAFFVEAGSPPPELMPFIAGAVILGAGWPVAVYMLAHRRAVADAFTAAETFDTPMFPNDRGVGSVAVMLLMLAAITLPLPVQMATSVIDEGGPRAPAFYITLATALFFVVRGVLAFRLGWRTVQTPPTFATFVRQLGQWRAAALVATIALLVTFVAIDKFRMMLGASPFIGLVLIGSIVMMTWIWPFVAGQLQQQLDMESASEGEPVALPAPSDAGLLTFGQSQLYLGILSIGSMVMVLGLGGIGALAELPASDMLFGISGNLSTWLAVGVALSHTALAIAAIRMGPAVRSLRPVFWTWLICSVGSATTAFIERAELGLLPFGEIATGVLELILPTIATFAILNSAMRRAR
jgi:hypothetical protein